jgi:hypothetical protein
MGYYYNHAYTYPNRHHGDYHGYGRLYLYIAEDEFVYDGMFSECKYHGKASSFAFL